jgi:hypothetical protein
VAQTSTGLSGLPVQVQPYAPKPGVPLITVNPGTPNPFPGGIDPSGPGGAAAGVATDNTGDAGRGSVTASINNGSAGNGGAACGSAATDSGSFVAAS